LGFQISDRNPEFPPQEKRGDMKVEF
jgi:hypothetical protein